MQIQLPDFSHARLLVVGDLMLDRYWQGATARISPEAPVPVVHVDQTEARPGGAANVAVNLGRLGCQVRLVGIAGRDEAGDQLESELQKLGIQCLFQREDSVPTITKLRVLSRHQQLIRLDFEQRLDAVASDEMEARFSDALPECQALILSAKDEHQQEVGGR